MAKGEDEAVRNVKRVEDDTTRGFWKRDADIEATRKDVSAIKDQLVGLKLDIAGVKSEQAIMRWMMGFLLAMVTTLLFKAFAH